MYPKNSNLFNESFFDTSHTLHSDISPSSCVNQTILIILSRIGFVLVQIGAVPRINVNFIILKNILDICCTTVAYFTLGFVLIFNGDANSLIYGDYYRFKDFLIRKDEFLIGWQAVVIASAIYTSSMVEETHVISHLLVSVLLAGLIQPLLIRWAWISEGWIAKSSLSGVKVVYRDHAGSGIVHVVGGLAGLIISLILSSKKKKTTAKSRNLRKISITSFCTGTLFLGSLLIFISLQNFSMPISEHNVKTTENTIINNLLASCSCSLFVMTLHFTFRQPIDHWTTTKCVQALIAGSVMVSAAADKYSPLMSIALGSSGGTIFYLVSRLMFSSELEDHCNIVATHLVCGFLANLLAPLCIFEIESDTPFVLLNLAWQLISIIIFMGLVIITLTPMLLILDTCDLLRQKLQVFNKKEAMNTFAMKKGLSDRNINYDRRTSMINTERLFTMKSSYENDESQNELPQEEESTFPKEDHASPEKNIRNEETSNVSQPSGLNRRLNN
ncbi:hypothetical protein KPH14_003890 [Odynerus spinipes]|uniref:Ammonium transporter AmtB-like domain-containing protein n=1 Tax=Odynerus spinipes TaxID=1348599 RepID=A0AAD9RXL5_9HYME|nr:hypothetical protein KPH14_003890 [Odynerus spinipes]